MEMLTHAINWAEIPVSDFDKAKKFYSTIYDFEMPEMLMSRWWKGFVLVDQEDGGINAAIHEGAVYNPSPNGIKIYLNGSKDLDAFLNKPEKAGRKIIPEFEHFVTFECPEGNYISMHYNR